MIPQNPSLTQILNENTQPIGIPMIKSMSSTNIQQPPMLLPISPLTSQHIPTIPQMTTNMVNFNIPQGPLSFASTSINNMIVSVSQVTPVQQNGMLMTVNDVRNILNPNINTQDHYINSHIANMKRVLTLAAPTLSLPSSKVLFLRRCSLLSVPWAFRILLLLFLRAVSDPPVPERNSMSK